MMSWLPVMVGQHGRKRLVLAFPPLLVCGSTTLVDEGNRSVRGVILVLSQDGAMDVERKDG